METLRTMEIDRGETSFDLIVIGGGPAGCSAAITAARSGVSVLLLERGRLPRQRVCGEFVSAESLSLLKELMGQQGNGLLQAAPRISRGRLFVDGRVISTRIEPAAASIARFDLDFALWQAALQAGVDARLQSSAAKIEGKGPFRVRTESEEFQAQAVVNATGRWSNLNRGALPHDGSRQRWLGLKGHFLERSAVGSVDLYFFDGGYCGVQPVGGWEKSTDGEGCRVNACAMVRADVASALEEVFARHPELCQRTASWERLWEPVTTSPLMFREPEAVRDGVFQAGDAAGFVDPFVGDGISLALRSGATAAQCVGEFVRGEISLVAGSDRYAHAYRRELLPIFRNSARLRRLLKLPKTLRKPIAHFLEGAPALTSYLVSKTR